MHRKRFKIVAVRGQYGPPGLCCCHDKRIDCRALAGLAAQLRSTPSEQLRGLLDDVTHLQEAIGRGVARRVAL